MPREKDGYRDNLALLNEMFPDTLMLNIKQAAKALGYKNPDNVKRVLNFKDRRISKAAVARYMCSD